MKIFGYRIVREKGMRIGDHVSAIIDLQERVNVLEHHQKVKVQEVRQETVERAVMQSEVDEVLSSGQVPVPGSSQDMWSTLEE